MSQHPAKVSDPNPLVREVYEELGDLLNQGDDAFIEQGPSVLQNAIQHEDFFENVTTDTAAPDEYTREKVIGDPNRHVIRYMEWPPEFTLMPHEHHGRPCFEVVVEGYLILANLERTELADDKFRFDVIDGKMAKPGDSAAIDPRKNEIHSVYTPVRSKSLHVYPSDEWKAYGYVLAGDASEGKDVYERQEFQLREPP